MEIPLNRIRSANAGTFFEDFAYVKIPRDINVQMRV